MRGNRTFCLFYWEQGTGKSKLCFILNSLGLSVYVDVLEESKKVACCQVNTMCLSNRLQNIYISATDWSAIGFGQSSFFCSNSGLKIPQRTGVRDSRVLRHKQDIYVTHSKLKRRHGSGGGRGVGCGAGSRHRRAEERAERGSQASRWHVTFTLGPTATTCITCTRWVRQRPGIDRRPCGLSPLP